MGAIAAASDKSGLAGDSVSAAAGEALRTFLGEEVVFDRYIFTPGPFPGVRWKDPDAVRTTVGPVPLTVEYYDRSFARVDRAAGPGMYGAVVRGTVSGGFPIVRYVTLFCSNVRFDDYGPDVPLALQSLPDFGIPSGHWEMYRKNLRRFSFGRARSRCSGVPRGTRRHDPRRVEPTYAAADRPPMVDHVQKAHRWRAAPGSGSVAPFARTSGPRARRGEGTLTSFSHSG